MALEHLARAVLGSMIGSDDRVDPRTEMECNVSVDEVDVARVRSASTSLTG